MTANTDIPVHELIEDPVFRRAVDLMDAGDVPGLEACLAENPDLPRQHASFPDKGYFSNPSLLAFIAENPIRHGRVPKNVVDVARTILTADQPPDQDSLNDTLLLVSSGRVVRECGVQVSLINLLCEHGADADEAMLSALGHGEFDAVEALLSQGAALDLPVAATTGRVSEARALLTKADPDQRHRALALSAQHGHADVVRLLLEAGEDPNRYNPPACHAHSTPLHQAALAGHEAVARRLLTHGARNDIPDKLFDATAAGWAEHAGHTALAKLISDAGRS